MRNCKRCNTDKEVSCYGDQKASADGVNPICKQCKNEEAKKYRRRVGLESGKVVSSPRRVDKHAESKECTSCEKLKPIGDYARDSCSASGSAASCKQCKAEAEKLRRRSDPAKQKEREAERYARDGEKRRKKNKEYMQKPESRATRSKNNKKRYRECKKFKSRYLIHSLLNRALRSTGKSKRCSAVASLGYAPSDLRQHLESKFCVGMTWGNHGEWHIDHIKPIAQFIKEGESDPATINALSNLQPLWAKDNLSKGAKFSE